MVHSVLLSAPWGFALLGGTGVYKIGVLHSVSGPYGAIGRDCRDGADVAIVQSRQVMPTLIEPVYVDPAGSLKGYVEGAISLLRDMGCKHIVGTVTSAARKEILPIVEKHDGLLWYTCPYEGFEANANAIYVAGCPNQHLFPLFDYLLPKFGNRPYLAGANYVWGWEMNRLARELVTAAGGEVAGERYLPIEETAVERLVADIEKSRPSFILNNLIGPSSYAFIATMHELASRKPEFAPGLCPIVSCDLTECELENLGPGEGIGHLSASCYFDGQAQIADTSRMASLRKTLGAKRKISSMFAASHAAMSLCVEAIHALGTDEPYAVRQYVTTTTSDTILGPLRIDPETNHAALPFHLGRINGQGGFDVMTSRPAIAADPYLTAPRPLHRARLRVVS